MKKNILMGLTALALSVPAFAQFDDVVKKPKEKKPSLFRLGKTEEAKAAVKYFLNVFNNIEISNLVDEMEREGVKEKKYTVTVGISGSIYVDNHEADPQELHAFPFTLKISGEKEVYLVASGIGLKNGFENTVGDEAWSPIDTMTMFVFKMDRGFSFKDIKTIGARTIDADLKIPVSGYSKTRYIALTAGGELGAEAQEITLDDGQKIIVGDDEDGDANAFANWMSSWRAGLEMREEVGRGHVTVGGKIEYTGVGAMNEAYLFSKRRQLYVKPSLSYTLPLSKKGKASMTLGVGANIAIKDEIKRPNNQTSIDLSNRNRQKYNASLKINF